MTGMLLNSSQLDSQSCDNTYDKIEFKETVPMKKTVNMIKNLNRHYYNNEAVNYVTVVSIISSPGLPMQRNVKFQFSPVLRNESWIPIPTPKFNHDI